MGFGTLTKCGSPDNTLSHICICEYVRGSREEYQEIDLGQFVLKLGKFLRFKNMKSAKSGIFRKESQISFQKFRNSSSGILKWKNIKGVKCLKNCKIRRFYKEM